TRLWTGIGEARRDLDLPEELVADAVRRARVTIGTAILLLGADVPGGDEASAKLAAEEGKRVEAAKGTMKPAWLGPPDPGFVAIDYARFRPRGFYDRDEALERYFRAVSWLQAVPFRVDRDSELLAVLLLSRIPEDPILRGYRELLGPGDEPALADLPVWSSPLDAAGLKSIRERVGSRPPTAVNDRVAFPNREVSVRILPSARLPDAVLFTRTTEGDPRRSPPTGLEVCAALGDAWARERLVKTEGAALVRTIHDARGLFDGPSLYDDYLRCLAALLDPPDRGAPAFMRSPLWQRKSAQTALAGWAQLRHTWTLQAKSNVHFLGATKTPAGLVEPDPEFFGRLGRLCWRTESLLERGGAFGADLERLELAEALTTFAGVLRRMTLKEIGGLLIGDREGLSPAERNAATTVEAIWHLEELKLSRDADDEESRSESAQAMEAVARKLRDLDTPLDERLARALRLASPGLERHWRSIRHMCDELEVLARKQLGGVPFDETDEYSIRTYGEDLAGAMLYEGNSWLSPRDDAPRITDVFSDPNRGTRLHVGIARPRAILVLYPWQGREVLCRGGVLPYREFEWGSPLTNGEWRSLLDSDDEPTAPAWLAPLSLPPSGK
ncbi:MAG: DUF3160 domain-containing protein, partial [Planctomycetota bacterium]